MRSALTVMKWALVAACAAPLASCTFIDSFVPKKGAESDIIDRQKGLTIDDFRNLNGIDKEADKKGEANVTATLGAPPIPDVAQVLAAPRPPKVANTKSVTLAVTDDVPLRDVLFELGRLAGVDIEVGAGLDKSGINLRATDRPFNEVIERIADLGGLRYSVSGKSIRVERDAPYIKSYSVDFLNMVRSSTSSYTLNTTAAGGGSGSSGGSSSASLATSGSQSAVTAKSESDLWNSLAASLKEILSYKGVGDDAGAEAATAAGNAVTTNASGAADGGSVVINRQAGVVSINATDRQHEMIKRYLDMMGRNTSAQVLIEAKVVEVALSDRFASGISWNKVLGDLKDTYANVGTYPVTAPAGLTVPSNPFSIKINAGSLDTIIAAAQQFGTVRTLSSPRLTAINNQAANLTFTRNEVTQACKYTPAKYDTNATTGVKTLTQEESFECTAGTLPIGIILSIMPAINLDTQEVTLSVRPTLNKVVDKVTDLTTAFARSKSLNPNTIPEAKLLVVETREIESITRMKSGAVMVIGGLMKDSTETTENGVPGVSEIPLFGNLFKSRSEDSQKSELIIFIKATIVNSDGSAHESDRKVYEKFMTDPRPLFPRDNAGQ